MTKENRFVLYQICKDYKQMAYVLFDVVATMINDQRSILFAATEIEVKVQKDEKKDKKEDKHSHKTPISDHPSVSSPSPDSYAYSPDFTAISPDQSPAQSPSLLKINSEYDTQIQLPYRASSLSPSLQRSHNDIINVHSNSQTHASEQTEKQNKQESHDEQTEQEKQEKQEVGEKQEPRSPRLAKTPSTVRGSMFRRSFLKINTQKDISSPRQSTMSISSQSVSSPSSPAVSSNMSNSS